MALPASAVQDRVIEEVANMIEHFRESVECGQKKNEKAKLVTWLQMI